MKIKGKEYKDISKLSVRPISKSVAKDIIVKNHYSGIWTKVSYCLGLYVEDDSHSFFSSTDKLIGVATYGDPIGRHSGQSISELLDRKEVLELTRLFVFDGYGCNVESWFVGQTFRWLRKHARHIIGLISYSDPKAGHLGTVYQSTNWIYQGNRIRPNDSWLFKFEENGEWQHGRTIFPYYGTNNPTKIQKVIGKTFWIKKEPRKHRYIYILYKSKKNRILKSLKYTSLQYPKKSELFEEEIKKLEPIERT